MTPDWQSSDGSIRLHNADCLDVMAAMEPDSVDTIVTDPPYGLTSGNSGKRIAHQLARSDLRQMDME